MIRPCRPLRLGALVLFWHCTMAAASAAAIVQAAPAGQQIDPEIETAVHRYFETQEAEDADGYLALWSESRRPRRENLQYIFDSGDDRFSDVTIGRVTTTATETRVRVSAMRTRTSRGRNGADSTVRSLMQVSLVFERGVDGWRLVRETPPADDLAAALLEATTPEDRTRLLSREPDLVNKALVDAIARRGSEFIQQQQYQRAQAAYEQMLAIARQIDDQKATGEALQNLANASYFQRNFTRALELYEQRLDVERGRQDDEGIAAALVGIATIRYSYAEYDAALARYREALAIQDGLPDRTGAATTLVSTGNVLYLLGDHTAAIADYSRSRQIFHELGDSRGEADALAGLGRVYVAQGDYASALTAFAGVVEEGRARSNRSQQGTALLSIGDVQFRLGNLEAARAALDESRGHFDAVPDPSNAGRARQGMALVDLVAGRFASAEVQYRLSITGCTASDDLDCAAAGRVGLGFSQFSQDRFADAADSYDAGIKAFTALNRTEAAARAEVGLSQALTGLKRFEEALAAAGRARHSAVGLSLDDVLWRALIAEARAFEQSGSAGRAIASARAAIYAIDEMRETARLRPGSPLPRDTAAAFATLVRLQAAAGDAAAAFDTSERMRVHALRAALAPNERDISRGMTTDEKSEERESAQTIATLRAQIARERGLPRPDAARLEGFERRLSEAVEARSAQQDRLFTRLPSLRVWRGLIEPAASSDLSALLSPGTLLLDLVVDDDGVVAFGAWTEEGKPRIVARATPTRRREIAAQVGRLLQPDVLRESALWRRAVDPIAGLLPTEITERIAATKRLIVVPHDLLWRVPFEAMPLGGTGVGVAVPVAYVSSVSASLRAARPAGVTGQAWLAVGAPTLSEAVVGEIGRTAPGWTIRPQASVRTELEVATAPERDAPAVRVLEGADATETGLRAALPSADMVQISAPFRVNAASPLFSPILLSAVQQPATAPDASPSHPLPSDAGGDGRLELREIFDLDLHARGVILTDPASLAMREAAGDAGIAGWAWQAAGVSALAMPRWTVDDPARERLLGELHRQLSHGRSLEDALAAARLDLRKSREWSAPFYWAGWLVVVGR
jgi:tetratricopeptide (TPR) repeat protein